MTDDMRKLIDEVQILGRLRDAGVLDPKAHAGLMDAAPALAAEVERQDARLAEVERERDEALLTLAAEQGRQEGAPRGWEWTGGMWRRNGYPHAVTARHYGPINLDLPWQWEVWDTRPALDVRLLGKGFEATARAAMLAADAATTPPAPAPTRG